MPSAEIPLLGQVGAYDVRATFPGTPSYAAASTAGANLFVITPQATTLCLDTDLDNDCDQADGVGSGLANAQAVVAAILQDVGIPPLRLVEQAVLFEVVGQTSYYAVVNTDYNGRAVLGGLPLAPGTYSVTARYRGTGELGASVATGTW